MPQTSKYPLDKEMEKIIFNKFWKSLSALRDAVAVSTFFSDFLSDTEELMLAKRFTIAVLLLRGRRPKDIKDILHVSNSATGAVGAWLKNAKPETLATLERVIKESNWEEFVDNIKAYIDELPPTHGTDWRRIGQERMQRSRTRFARKSLR